MGLIVRQLRLTTFAAIACAAMSAVGAELPQRHLYAVNESAPDRGSISIYDIDAGHRLLKTIRTVSKVDDVRGVAGSAVSGKLYVAYRDTSGSGMLYCLDIYHATVLWNRKVAPGVDRPGVAVVQRAALTAKSAPLMMLPPWLFKVPLVVTELLLGPAACRPGC